MAIETGSIIPMTQEFARAISTWEYEGIYSFYNHSSEQIGGFLDGTHYACLDSSGELIGFFCFGDDARVPTVEENVYADGYLDVGLGLRPDLCGKRHGLSFLSGGLDYAMNALSATSFRLSVAAFNERAASVYKKAGFTVTREVTNSRFMNKFYIMTKVF